MDDIVAAAITLVSKRIGEHQIKTDTPREIILFPIDARLFTQILVNLLDNAFRHSGKDSVVIISVTVHKKHIVFTVSDNGKGIPEEKLDQVFDNFFTTAYQNGDKQRGVGLGLTICKAIVEAHDGRISAYNNESGGATFQIELPMEENRDE